MRTRPFGRTDWHIAEIGFGAWAVGGGGGLAYGDTDDAESRGALHKALLLGVNFFDTADIYGRGHSEVLVGEVLEPVRDKVYIATKVGYDFSGGQIRENFTPEYIHKAIEASLKRLRTDRVDVYQLHNPGAEVVKAGQAIDALAELKEEGKTLAIGVSVHDEEEALAAIERGVDAIQLVYNYLQPEMDRRVLKAAADRGVAVIAREPLCRGLLTGKYKRGATFAKNDVRSRYSPEELGRLLDGVEDFKSALKPGLTPARAALKFVLARPEVSVVIPGAKTAAQVDENGETSDGKYAVFGDIFDSAAVRKGLGGGAP